MAFLDITVIECHMQHELHAIDLTFTNVMILKWLYWSGQYM